MEMTVETHGQVTVLRFKGSILGDDRYELNDTVKDAARSGARRIVLNLRDASLIDSVGLGALLATHTSLARRGVSLALCEVGQSIKQLLKLTNLDRVLDLHETEVEARSVPSNGLVV